MYGLDVALETFPADDVPSDPKAYLAAMRTMRPGDYVCIFTPDDTHFDICGAAIDHGPRRSAQSIHPLTPGRQACTLW